jgi:hypothetical protein
MVFDAGSEVELEQQSQGIPDSKMTPVKNRAAKK